MVDHQIQIKGLLALLRLELLGQIAVNDNEKVKVKPKFKMLSQRV